MDPFEGPVNYHHYSFTFERAKLPEKLAGVKLIFIAGCRLRAEKQAQHLLDNLKCDNNEKFKLEILTKQSSRFSLFRVGPALIGDHGMGGPSMLIAVHELVLMSREANILDQVTLIRFGTCGGIGVSSGDICITRQALNPLLQDFVDLRICLKIVRRQCIVDQTTADLIEKLAREHSNEDELGRYNIYSGATLTADDFYEEQGRTNGAICEHSLEDRAKLLQTAQSRGVINIEMESSHLAAICHKIGISFGVICVALFNRLDGDQLELSPKHHELFERRLFSINLQLVLHKMREMN